MKGFIIAPLHNKPNRHDATGAFQSGATIFQKLYGFPKFYFDNSGEKKDIRNRVLKAMADQPSGWNVFAYFGHGDSTNLPSAEFYGREGAQDFADAIRPKAAQNITIMLYACNAGKLDGFASRLADNLKDLNPRVFAHLPPPGHSFTNANVVRYPGGDMVVSHASPRWKDWYHQMKKDKSDFWARFPFMTKQELDLKLIIPDELLGRWEVTDGRATWNSVFFPNQVVVSTGKGAEKYKVKECGKWYRVPKGVTVNWNSGNGEDWPLPITINQQRVKPGGKLQLRARRIEVLDMNPQALFNTAMRTIKTGLNQLMPAWGQTSR